MKPITHGFTLMDLLAVITIIAVLASILMPAVQSVRFAEKKPFAKIIYGNCA